MPCVTHVTLWVFTLSGSPHRLAGWVVVYAVGCPWHHIVGLWGGLSVSRLGLGWCIIVPWRCCPLGVADMPLNGLYGAFSRPVACVVIYVSVWAVNGL